MVPITYRILLLHYRVFSGARKTAFVKPTPNIAISLLKFRFQFWAWVYKSPQEVWERWKNHRIWWSNSCPLFQLLTLWQWVWNLHLQPTSLFGAPEPPAPIPARSLHIRYFKGISNSACPKLSPCSCLPALLPKTGPRGSQRRPCNVKGYLTQKMVPSHPGQNPESLLLVVLHHNQIIPSCSPFYTPIVLESSHFSHPRVYSTNISLNNSSSCLPWLSNFVLVPPYVFLPDSHSSLSKTHISPLLRTLQWLLTALEPNRSAHPGLQGPLGISIVPWTHHALDNLPDSLHPAKANSESMSHLHTAFTLRPGEVSPTLPPGVSYLSLHLMSFYWIIPFMKLNTMPVLVGNKAPRFSAVVFQG